MDAIQFTTVVGPDGLIHPPEGVLLPEGEVEVSVRSRNGQNESADPLARTRAWLLAVAAESEAANAGLPSDLAEQHDHYAHGAPKR